MHCLGQLNFTFQKASYPKVTWRKVCGSLNITKIVKQVTYNSHGGTCMASSPILLKRDILGINTFLKGITEALSLPHSGLNNLQWQSFPHCPQKIQPDDPKQTLSLQEVGSHKFLSDFQLTSNEHFVYSLYLMVQGGFIVHNQHFKIFFIRKLYIIITDLT